MSSYMIESVPEKCKACRRCEIACIAAHHGLTFKEALKSATNSSPASMSSRAAR